MLTLGRSARLASLHPPLALPVSPQVFHFCALADTEGGLSTYSFLCPNGTMFQQQYFVCDWWFNVDCSTTEDFYGLNDEIAAEREANSPAGGAGGGARGGAGGGRRGGQGAASYNSPSYSSPQVRLSTRGQRSVCPQAGYTRNQRDLPGSPQQQQYLAQLLAQTTQVGGGSLALYWPRRQQHYDLSHHGNVPIDNDTTVKDLL